MKWKTTAKDDSQRHIFLTSLAGPHWVTVDIDGTTYQARLLPEVYLLQARMNGVIYNYRVRSLEPLSSRFGQHHYRVELIAPGSRRTFSKKVSLQLYSPLPDSAQSAQRSSSVAVEAPMNGKVLKVMVPENSKVSEGQCILIVEAMKMENSIYAPIDGTLKELLVSENDQVSVNQKLFRVDK